MSKDNQTPLRYGTKLTREQSDKLMTSHGLTDPDKIRAHEINMLIDRKLGIDFPANLRSDLIKEVNKQDSQRVWHIIKGFALFRSPWNSMVIEMVRGYSKFLSRRDIVELLSLPPEQVNDILGNRKDPRA